NYRQTGEIDTFQIVVFIFIIYACTFGISDFKKLDRYIKQTVGKWRKVDLLTEKDRAVMEKQQNPKYIARRYRLWWYGHTIAFIILTLFFGNYMEIKRQSFYRIFKIGLDLKKRRFIMHHINMK